MIKENFIKLYENSFKENWDLPCYKTTLLRMDKWQKK